MSTILIIGASSGIGQQLAVQLASAGHQVIGTYHSKPTTSETPNLTYHHCNVLDEQPEFSFVPEAIDGLVYCPGSIMLKPFHRIKPADFLNDYQLQVIGAIKTIQATLPALKKGKQSSIVLFSTAAVQTGLNFHTLVSSSKGALEGMTRALAAELAPSIRVNCVAPSLTDTPMAASLLNTDEKRAANALRHPLRRIGTPSDIANMVEFLLTEKSGWITGQIMHVDGGISNLKV
ncbi:MAG: SDR family oxidoreductase [Saprospiraceae bacterium]|nr:SDR family oxidoreductase [Saprospiraceae bacterium]